MTGYSKINVNNNFILDNILLQLNKISWFVGIITTDDKSTGSIYYNGPILITTVNILYPYLLGVLMGEILSNRTRFSVSYLNGEYPNTSFAYMTGTLYYNGTPVYPD